MATSKDRPDHGRSDAYDDDRQVESMKEARERVADIVKRLRENPKEFREIQEKLRVADSDDQRVDLLVDFAVTEERIAALVPSTIGGGQAMATVTTVTVTTVTIPDTAY